MTKRLEGRSLAGRDGAGCAKLIGLVSYLLVTSSQRLRVKLSRAVSEKKGWDMHELGFVKSCRLLSDNQGLIGSRARQS